MATDITLTVLKTTLANFDENCIYKHLCRVMAVVMTSLCRCHVAFWTAPCSKVLPYSLWLEKWSSSLENNKGPKLQIITQVKSRPCKSYIIIARSEGDMGFKMHRGSTEHFTCIKISAELWDFRISAEATRRAKKTSFIFFIFLPSLSLLRSLSLFTSCNPPSLQNK